MPAAVGLADDDRDLRHPRVRERRDDVLVAGEDAAALRVLADHQARDVLEERQRDVERVAELREAGELGQRRHVEHARALHRLAGDDADGVALDPREAGDQAAAVALAPLEQRVGVDDALDHLAHVVAAARLARDERGQLGRVARRIDGRRVRGGQRGRVGHEREVAAHRVERLGLAVDDRVDGAAGLVRDLRAAELVGLDLLADRRLDHGRAGQRDRRVVAHDHEVAHRGVQRGVAVGRAEHRGHVRDRREAGGRLQERAEVERDAGEAPAEQIRQAAAVVVGEADQRDAAAPGPLGDPVLLAHVDRRRGAGQDGRVDGDDRHAAAVDAAEAGDDAVARGDLVRAPELRLGEHAELVPGVGVDQLVDALAGRLAAGGANLLDVTLTAAFKALAAPSLELLVGICGHGRFG